MLARLLRWLRSLRRGPSPEELEDELAAREGAEEVIEKRDTARARAR
jgi:hypothetical protein